MSVPKKNKNKNFGRIAKGSMAAMLAALICVFSASIPAFAAETDGVTVVEGTSYSFPTGSASVNITLDGKRILEDDAVIINSVTYVPVRKFSEIVGAQKISWNANTRTATVVSGSTSITIAEGGYYISANDRCFYTVEKILNIDGRLFVPVRAICKAFCIDVGWDSNTRTAVLKTTGKKLVSGADFYRSNDLYWLSRIISAESSGEVLKGKIAVGNVVLNRVESSNYPNTIYGVIFDRKHGTQFSPVSLGTIYKTPTAESIVAAKICLEGYSISESILFFMNPRIATNNWISNNRPFAFTIGNHDFYY